MSLDIAQIKISLPQAVSAKSVVAKIKPNLLSVSYPDMQLNEGGEAASEAEKVLRPQGGHLFGTISTGEGNANTLIPESGSHTNSFCLVL